MRAGSMGVDTCLQNSGSVCYVLRVWWFFAVVAVMRGSAGSGACPRDSPSLVCVHAVRCERLDCRLRPRLRPAAPAVLAICTLAAVRRRHPRWRHDAACGCLRATGEVDAANAEGHWESGSFPQSSQDTVVKTIQTPSFALWLGIGQSTRLSRWIQAPLFALSVGGRGSRLFGHGDPK